MLVSEKIRLYPTKEQEIQFFSFSGTARFIYNECLAYKIKMYQDYNYSCSVQDLIKHIQDLKYSDEYLWLQDTPEAVSKQSINDLDKAYKSFFKRGNKGFPKFKKRSRSKLSFYQRTDKLRVVDSNHIKITGIKEPVRVRNSDLVSPFKNSRVTYDGKYWYLSYSYEVTSLPKSTSGKVIGVDLGVKSLAVTSDGVVYKNINKPKELSS